MTQGGIVTLLFTDVVNSTELLGRLGDERAEAIRRTHFKTLRDVIAEHSGTEVKSMGDGVMVVFASATDAVRCAVAMQQAVSIQDVNLRVGLNVGEPMREGDDYFGTPVVVASRLCDAAAGGQILCSDLVQALVRARGEFPFHDAGFLALKGIEEPMAAWEVGWERPASQRIPLPSPLSAGERLPFVGRDQLLDDLTVQWKKARDGHRALVMLAGEPGIGKTRLAAEFSNRAYADGALVLFGHADEETLLPYQPFVEAFQHVVRSLPVDALRVLIGENGPELGRLLPALHDRVPGLPEPLRSEPDSERFRLFEAATEFVAALAATAPIVLVLDDLHWADRPTLLLLHHLFRSPTDLGLLVIGTYRDTDLDRRHPLADTLADLRRLVQFERLGVSGLGEPDLLEFIDLVTGQSPPIEFARAVLDQTEGNPFFIGEVLRHLIESGAVSVIDGEWVPTIEPDQLGIPEGVKEVIGRRVTRLSEDANVVLAAAAVTGRDFELDVLDRVTELGDERLLAAVEEAVAARLVTEVSGGSSSFRFSHALVRETLYDELTTARRVRMHRRIAEIVEELHGADPDPPLSQLAYHWCESASAADAVKAVDYARRAGARAFDHLAYEEAASHFARGLEAAELSDGIEERTRGELFIDLATARDACGDVPGSRAEFDRAGEVGRRLNDGVLLARAALGRARLFTTGTMDPENVSRLEEALAALPVEDSSERARVLCRLGMELYWGGDRERMESLAHDGLAMARRVGDPQALGPALNVAAILYDSPTDSEARLALMQEAIALSTTHRDAAVNHLATGLASWSQLEMGDFEGFEATIKAGKAMVAEARLPITNWWVPVWDATRANLQGRVDEGERFAFEGFSLGHAAEDPGVLQVFGAQIYAVRRDQSRLTELDGSIRSMIEEYPAVPAWRCAMALMLAETGDIEAARAELVELARDEFRAVTRDNIWLTAMSLVGGTAFLVGPGAPVRGAYEQLLPFEHRFVVVGQVLFEGSVARILGELAFGEGRLDDAVVHFERGIAADRGMTAARSALYGQVELAATLLRRNAPGDSERAAELATETRPEAEALGNDNVVRRVDALRQ